PSVEAGNAHQSTYHAARMDTLSSSFSQRVDDDTDIRRPENYNTQREQTFFWY
ncbi:hypothetical protein L9F63_015122, partial [Diploptera punctata]